MNIRRVSLAGAFWLLASSVALSQELPELLAAAAPKGNERSLADARVLRSRFVELNRDSVMSPLEGRRRITLNLFSNTRWNVEEIRGYWSQDKSTFLWHGRIEGMERGFVILGITGEIASAQIYTDAGEEFQIRWVADRLHVIQEVNPEPGTVREDSVAVPESELIVDKGADRLAASAPRGATAVIDVLVAYTARARDEAGGESAILNKIQTTVASTNQTFANSGVDMQINLVHTMLVNYADMGTEVTAALAPLRGTSDGVMDEVHAARDTYGADLVCLWIQGIAGNAAGGTVGYAYQLASVSTSFAPWAFSVVEQYWAPSQTMAHELGHNMGAQHDRGNLGTPPISGAYSYSYGYQNAVLGSAFRTIMAYQCAGINCPKIPYWSNPVVSYNGTPTGVASNQANSADNAQTLNNTGATVAAFRSGASGCSYSISPTSATVGSSAGSGTVSVTASAGCNWTASTGTAWLQVTSGASGTGNGTVGYSYTANATTSSRGGSITIAGSTFSVTQSGTAGGTVSITVESAPSGLSVVVGGSTVTTPYSVNWPTGTNLTLNAPATQGSGGTRYSFFSWSNGGAASQTVTPSSATIYTVTYQTQYLLTSAASPSAGGSLAIAPSSPDGYYNAGVGVQISAIPNSGYNFSSWTGSATGTANPLSINMSAPRSVTANFTGGSGGSGSVTIATAPAGLQILVDGVAYTSPQVFQWSAGSVHTIGTTSPQGNSQTRYVFATWSDGGAISHSVTAPATATTITANFTTQYALGVVIAPISSGSVTASPASPDGFYSAGTTVQLTAQPLVTYSFAGWTGDLTGITNPGSVVMNGTRSITANFSRSGTCGYTLSQNETSVSASGDVRTVTVTSAPECTWSVQTSLSWVQITSGTQVNGSGTVRMVIAANTATSPRAGVVTIAGTPYTITQTAASCTFQLTNPGNTIPAAGATAAIGVTTTVGCQWSAAESSPWITLSGATSGSSSGSVSFTAAANTSPVPRTATITIGGITLHFVQKGSNTAQIYNDVLASNLFFDYITLLGLANIPDLCGTAAYCPDATINRASMAIFLVRTLAGDAFNFTQTPYFSDVPASHPQFAYIQKLRDLGVTNGCGNGQYCPADPVTRGQMAAFLVRARLGVTFSQAFPYNATQPFADVDTNNIFFAYIQKLRELGITTGCTAITFCPNDLNTRGQMGAFMARGFF